MPARLALLVASIVAFAVVPVAPSAAAEPPAVQRKGPELLATVAAVVRPSAEGRAVGSSRVTGEEHRGDVLEVLQNLADALDTEEGGPGGKIVIADGLYITARDEPLKLRSGVHIAAARRHGAVLKLADGAADRRRRGWFFTGRRVRDVVVDGIVFDGNRDAQTVITRLTRDASAGDTAIHVADASKFADRKRELGIGRGKRKVWTTPGGFQIRDQHGEERAKASAVDTDANVIKLLFPLRHGYAADAGAEAVFYPRIGAVTVNGGNFAVRNCKCIHTQESPVLFASGGADQPGPKVLENNIVLDHRGDACVRLQRRTHGGIIRGNTVVRPRAWYQRFWGEGVAIEGNAHSLVHGNVIVGPGDRLIRANDTHHCVISNNIVWVPLLDFDDCDGAAAWKPLRGDETVEADAEDKRQGRAALRVAAVGAGAEAKAAGIRMPDLAGEQRDWSDVNRAYLWVKPQDGTPDLRLRLLDGQGRSADYRTVTWAAGEWQIAIFDLTEPADASEAEVDKRDVRELQIRFDGSAGQATVRVDDLRLG
ncbi:MAG: right-handed parallel beta-helix repeat-containing protein, partial [Planctomycetota bacterium]